MKISKNGAHFCCREHKDLGQRISSGIESIWPDHYKQGNFSDYRKHALEHYGAKCLGCGYDKYECVLQVHHIDKNRKNNKLENLWVCCPTCHVEKHMIDNKVQFFNRGSGQIRTDE